jgi:hypothetical protein
VHTAVRKALVVATSVLAIGLISQSPASATEYLSSPELVNVCTPNPSAELPSACVCIDEPTCVFDIYYEPGNGISTPASFVCRIMPGSLHDLLGAGEPRVENPCNGFPYN